ncbi:MAG: RNA 3'-terminal phosphate cyclase [Candidatus Acidiferrum sp.]
MTAFIELDGAAGEGGGQILRTSLSLSMVTGRPFRVENIRAGRRKPGLLRQHLTAVLAAAEISGAHVEGAVLGSKSLSFAPGAVRSGEYKFAVGTAGSATLVFQTLLPALMLASGPSVLTIDGGTHNLAAPPFDFLEKTFLSFVRRMGPRISVRLNRYGFYPAGGGSITAEIEPVEKLAALEIMHSGENPRVTGRAVLANLPGHIAARELGAVARRFGLEKSSLEILHTKNSAGPGNVVMVECQSADAIHVFTAFGRLGVSAEQVAEEAIEQAQVFIGGRVAADEHLADQILLPMALGEGGSFSTTNLTSHSVTNMGVIQKFLQARFEIEKSHGQSYAVRVSPG